MTTKDAAINLRVNSDLKARVNKDLEKMGLDMSTLIIMTLKAVDRTHSLPFMPTAISPLDEAIAEVSAGRTSEPVSLAEHLAEVAKLADED